MDNLEKKCEHCGATYIVSDGYCKECWKRIPTTASKKEELLDEVKKADWHFFIDKNASRYVEIYSKNEGKKFFLSWNWAAFFFNVNWMFYRKMYKNAILFSLLYSLIIVLVILLISTAYMGQLKPLYNEVITYEENYNSDIFTANNSNLIIESNGDPIKAYKAREEIESIMKRITLWSALGILFLQIPFGLFADCIYKSHILKNVKNLDGGTSYIAFFVGGLCNNIFDRIIVSPIVTYLILLFMK